MAFYLNRLPDGKSLPKKGKWDFFLRNVKGSKYLGTDAPRDFFDFVVNGKSELVAIGEHVDYDAACWIDIPRQLEICRNGGGLTVHWMRIPEAYKMVIDEFE